MGCLVQPIRETLATEVSVEIGKPISLLSNRALGPVLHSLIQMRVPRTGLAKIDPHTLSPLLSLTDGRTHMHTNMELLSRPPSLQPAWCISSALSLSSSIYFVLLPAVKPTYMSHSAAPVCSNCWICIKTPKCTFLHPDYTAYMSVIYERKLDSAAAIMLKLPPTTSYVFWFF